MFAQALHARRRRRGVVLVLILGMLTLLALIGVTFATFSGQAQVGARHYAESLAYPLSDEVMDYALSQLINDSNNPASAIRGHSLKRDMYGPDAENNGFLGREIVSGASLTIEDYRVDPSGTPTTGGHLQVRTNIPALSDTPAAFAYLDTNFFGWTMRLGGAGVSQTFHIVGDDASGSDPFCVGNDGRDKRLLTLSTAPEDAIAALSEPAIGQIFVLDGRFIRGFNGRGVNGSLAGPETSAFRAGLYPYAQFANYRFNRNVLNAIVNNGPNPAIPDYFDFQDSTTLFAVDEDYDAPDLENWFLAVQSADGRVVIPSFHRPSVIRYDPNHPTAPVNDWIDLASTATRSKFLRPRKIDHPSSGDSFPDLTPDPATGEITYDVDNDGDGVKDSVWLDLGYPVQRDATGRMFKPLFAFTVLGLNGRLPLNTVGNVQGIYAFNDPTTDVDDRGYPTFDHTSHTGNSVNEINPRFALQNAPDENAYLPPTDPLNRLSWYGWNATTPNPNGYSQVDNADINPFPALGPPTPSWVYTDVSLTQLRNLLTGTRPQINPNVPPLAAPNNGLNLDSDVVNINGVPHYLANGMGDNDSGVVRNVPPIEGRWGEGDRIAPATQQVQLSATPGMLVNPPYFSNQVRAGRSFYADGADDDYDTFDFAHTTGTYPEDDNYPDAVGAIQIPSERIRRFVWPYDPSGNGIIARYDEFPDLPVALGGTSPYGLGPDDRGRVGFFHYFRPPGLLPPTAPTKNLLHGFDAHQLPGGDTTVTPPRSPQMAAMPYLLNSGTSIPTYNPASPDFHNVNTWPGAHATAYPPYDNNQTAGGTYPDVVNGYIAGSLNRDEADEMRLYDATRVDAPFGPQDLEWLYRSNDTDGTSLSSRLAQLAPISFLNPKDGPMRRRLFSLESWEHNSFSLNPEVPDMVTALAAYGVDARADGWTRSADLGTGAVGYKTVGTPALATRDRKINLNHPLPNQNYVGGHNEPVRQKWINDAYLLARAVLPNPIRQDLDMLGNPVPDPFPNDRNYTPEDCAAMSQFLVNVIDFRDPDDVMTQYTNQEVMIVPGHITPTSLPPPPARGGTTVGTPYPANTPIAPRLIWASESDPAVYPWNAGAVPLVQYGMEYNPIAINEVMAYQWDGGGALGKHFYMEIVNTLTVGGSGAAGAHDLQLDGWKIAFGRDDVENRPDPHTGQIPPGAAFDQTDVTALAPIPITAANKVPPMNADGTFPPNYHYVIGNRPGTGAPLQSIPVTANAEFDETDLFDTTANPTNGKLPQLGAAETRYYWAYLMRPANPADTTSPMVVVDSMRFLFRDDGPGNNNGRLYSMERFQPYRGGQAIPKPYNATTPPTPFDYQVMDYRYGYSEQTKPCQSSVRNNRGQTTAGGNATGQINDSLGQANEDAEDWDLFPFLDRDFTSVAELLLVPGTGPGMFTKQFVENDSTCWWAMDEVFDDAHVSPDTPPRNQPPGPVIRRKANSSTVRIGVPLHRQTNDPEPAQPHAYPYLVDKFYYNAVNPTVPAPPNPPTPTEPVVQSDGWYQLLEYFEVPNSSFGAIGTVAQGSNTDWFRRDTTPGRINLNLIIDEEVFFGLFDDPRLNYKSMPPLTVTSTVPSIAQAIDASGSPATSNSVVRSVSMDVRRGFMYRALPDPGGVSPPVVVPWMKQSFADFLKMMHGGSNVLFSYGYPTSGIAPPRPFRSASASSILETVLRPATFPYLTGSVFSSARDTDDGAADPVVPDDVGLRVPTLPYTPGPGERLNPAAPSRTVIPPRRLFQVPDSSGWSNAGVSAPWGNQQPDPPPAMASTRPAEVNHHHPALADEAANLFEFDFPNARTNVLHTLGGDEEDRRQHPLFRTEMLQKVMNLTTVRTHQYAVWVTVGFFEVVTPGNPALVSKPLPANGIDPARDQLGQEIGLQTGRNVRYRSFFLVDRTRATGFSTNRPTDFRECVTYRRRIE